MKSSPTIPRRFADRFVALIFLLLGGTLPGQMPVDGCTGIRK